MKIELLYTTVDDLEVLHFKMYHRVRRHFLLLDAVPVMQAREWNRILNI